jgi:hypothetical protein
MTVDTGTNKGPDVSKVPHVGGARPSAAPTPPPASPKIEPRVEAPKLGAAAPRPSEQHFSQSLAGLSRSLGERAALHPDPVAEAAARRATVLAQIRAEDQRLKLVLGIAGAAVAAVCLAAAIVFIAAPFGPRATAPAVEAKVQPPAVEPPPPPVQAAAVTPSPEPSPPPPVQMAVAEPAPTAAPPPDTAPSPPPAPSPAPLARDDIKEIQTRLLAFGFNAGPADGNAGRMTEGAIMHYQQKRGLLQTGKPDRALLDQLRQDPAPTMVASQPPPKSQSRAQPSRTASAGPQRRSDGLDFVRDADDRLSRWFQSWSR